MSIFRIFRALAAHQHVWRCMTSKEDYANGDSPHFGGYWGAKEQICDGCGIKREVRGWQAWKYDLNNAEKRVKYLLDTEPPHE